MTLNFLHILLIILSFQLLFISVFLFQSKKGKRLSNILLAFVFLLFGISVINLLITLMGFSDNLPFFLFLDDCFFLLYGLMLFLFTKSVLFKNYKLDKRELLHFIPFVFSLCTLLVVIVFLDTSKLHEAVVRVIDVQVPWQFKLLELLFFSHILFYLFWSLKKIKNVRESALNSYSNFKQDNIKHLLFIVYSFIAIFLLALIHAFLMVLERPAVLIVTLFTLIGYIFYFVNSILLKMLNESTNESGLIFVNDYTGKRKYASSKLTHENLQEYKTRLSSFMQSNQPYLDSELNLHRLARQLEIAPKLLSQVINEGFSCNFFDFVNRYRIEDIKNKLMEDDNNRTIQETMYEYGFSSKSSFNTAFKKITNLTPSQFKNQLNQKGSTS